MDNVILIGAGTATFIPSGTNPTPVRMWTKSTSLEISGQTKELQGANLLPDFVANTGKSISVKSKLSRVQGSVAALSLSGATSDTGCVRVADQTATIPTTPFAVTVTNSATFSEDLGVIDSDGNNMKCVASSPATGEYSVAAGVYTFALADVGKTVGIRYAYTSTSGDQVTYTNQGIGEISPGVLWLSGKTNSREVTVKLYAFIVSKFATSFQNDDFSQPDFEGVAFANTLGKVIDLSFI